MVTLTRRYKRAGKRVVFTNGCFDILHTGHLQIFYRCKQLGDILVVGLNSDKSVCRIKGPKRPVVPELDRAKMLAALTPVDHVVVYNEDTPEKVIRALVPDILVKGGDWKYNDIIGHDIAGETVRIKVIAGKSTTGIIKKILNAYGKKK